MPGSISPTGLALVLGLFDLGMSLEIGDSARLSASGAEGDSALVTEAVFPALFTNLLLLAGISLDLAFLLMRLVRLEEAPDWRFRFFELCLGVFLHEITDVWKMENLQATPRQWARPHLCAFSVDYEIL
jgi:hypothetical protein